MNANHAPLLHPPLLSIEGLEVGLYHGGRYLKIVRDLNLTIPRAQTLGIVGESGCGKTMTAMSIGGLVPDYVDVTARAVRWNGDLISLSSLRGLCGSKISYVFQDPMTALNPLMTVADQIGESLRGDRLRKSTRDQMVCDLLAEVGIRDPRRCAGLYPWELSGGMAQRVLIAMALTSEPELLIADEPTTAIDATVKKAVIELITDIQARRGLALLLISHDLGVVRAQADEIAVMYAGRVVELGAAGALVSAPRHPYTQALIACVLDPFRQTQLAPILGEPPRPQAVGLDCAFRPRCARSIDCCASAPALERAPSGATTAVACWNPVGEAV